MKDRGRKEGEERREREREREREIFPYIHHIKF
jgi:hypothetical protein